MQKSNKKHADIYQQITDKILTSLEQGVRPWLKPWTGGAVGLPLRHNGKSYSGINIPILWGEATDRGYLSRHWFTYRQAQELGGQVRKGEKSVLIVFASTFTKQRKDEVTGEKVAETIPFLKQYPVFNADQIDGLPEQYVVKPADPLPEAQRIAHAEQFVLSIGATIRHGGGSAHYSTVLDYIQMPEFSRFRSAEAYYSTLVHELVHWTGHESRLKRFVKGSRYGSENYAAEELVAELGSAFLCAELGIVPEVREDHAAYIGAWLKALRNDKRCVVQAASAASKAVEWLKLAAGGVVVGNGEEENDMEVAA